MRAILFDLDGTLVDTMASTPQAYADTIRALGGPVVSPSDVVATWHIGPTPVVLAHFLGRAATAEDVETFHDHVARGDVRPFPGVTELLGDLRDEGYLLGVYTSATRRAAAFKMRSAGIDLPLVAGDEVERPKPAPDGLELLCCLLGVAPSDSAYVGDAQTDLQCAAAAGALGIHTPLGVSATVISAALARGR
ncbi:HAD family hydrolase [Nonomuraea sp. NPDC050556]|uniref:HAD family hydrolase n=1 Tax=Nonomuraea sp. NPDC050556 TaxID=3364369 RepID=UPI00379D6DE2